MFNFHSICFNLLLEYYIQIYVYLFFYVVWVQIVIYVCSTIFSIRIQYLLFCYTLDCHSICVRFVINLCLLISDLYEPCAINYIKKLFFIYVFNLSLTYIRFVFQMRTIYIQNLLNFHSICVQHPINVCSNLKDDYEQLGLNI